MKEAPRCSPPSVRLSRGYCLAGGVVALCAGVAFLLVGPAKSLPLTAGLLSGGAALMFLAFSRTDHADATPGEDEDITG
ncbi:hypothetical protein [Noviherbaspirillum massiliense]|uniref:hypothetical protein n=1 Tax=Noviherbaspirillum massiliense TaxID=1465823 RepID=UPI0011DDC883|nr:hypothetical protein [Noviherbaspirillum massiliense]